MRILSARGSRNAPIDVVPREPREARDGLGNVHAVAQEIAEDDDVFDALGIEACERGVEREDVRVDVAHDADLHPMNSGMRA